MYRPTRYDRVTLLIRFMRTRPVEHNTFTRLSRALDIPYSSVRETIKKHYPHCFEEKPGVGWQITGAQPEPDIPFDFTLPPILPAPMASVAEPTLPPAEQRKGRQQGWVWSQPALRYLDTLWPGQSFADVLKKAHENNKLDELEIIGKTMSKAARDMKTLGEVPY